MNPIRAIKPKTWLTVAKAILALMSAGMVLVDGQRELLALFGIAFGLVGVAIGFAWYSHRASQPDSAADGSMRRG